MTDAASSPQIFPRFAGKTVLVTGAGTGLRRRDRRARRAGGREGRGALPLVAAGAEQTLDRIREAGSDGILVQGDIGSWAEIKRMADEVFAAFGILDVLVNNVGDVSMRADVTGAISPRRPSTPSSTSTSRARCS